MARTGKASAPWALRAKRRQLPAADYSGHLATGRETLRTLAASSATVTPRAYTIADLKASQARIVKGGDK